MAFLRLLCLTLALVLPGVAAVGPGRAQETSAVDYAAWDGDARTAEEVIAAGRASNAAMEDLRARIVEWRTTFDKARGANAAQIATLKDQIAALGPPPADGAAEAPETAARRRELSEILSRQQAPSIAAEEAFSRADGIIRQIDTLIRERQADALLRLFPSPINPLHWPSGAAVLSQGVKTLAAEVNEAWDNPARQVTLRNNLPLISICLALAVFLMAYAPGFLERQSRRLQTRASMRARGLVSALVSLGQILLPVGGMVLVLVATMLTGMTGPRLTALVEALPKAAFAYFGARWFAHWLFPDEHNVEHMRLTNRPGEARFHIRMIGLMLAVEGFREAFTTEVRPPLSQAAQAVWLAPTVCIVAIFVFRLGLLLRRIGRTDAGVAGDALAFRNRMVALAGTLMAAVAVIAPILAAIGYVTAANALIWPTIGSAALIGLIILAQRFFTDVYVLVTRSGEEGREALIPVLSGFLLGLGALPLFALIWGARPADLSEVWTRFKAGFSLGGAQISPTAVLTLFIVFILGYMVTRLVQGAMRSSVLPRTRLDKGAQNAAVAGLGYIGIFLSGLAAVNAAGIDLSTLAIVAGALSVGIGFGLQNIVQNFISGIILLVERPITEGDLIEVGDKIGTVTAISVRSTRILTGDQTEVIVPNAQFISGVVTNWTRDNLRGRAVVPVTVVPGSETRQVEQVLREIAEAQPLVLIDPAPSVVLTGFGAQGINFEIRAILSDLNFKAQVQSDILHQIAARFAAEGIELAMGRQDVSLLPDVPARKAPSARPKRAAPKPRPVAPSTINNDPRADPDEREDERR
jgi:small-conductance mechanosensitive channel